MLTMKAMMETLPQVGQVRWIGLRPERRSPLTVVESAQITEELGLQDDHFAGKPGSKRQVTLIQYEHIKTVEAILERESIDPGLLRRNIVVSGINLQSLKDRPFQLGDAVLCGTGNCPPCSRMEENLGPGGYNAMRGHGGITARVVSGGQVRVGSEVRICASVPAD